MQSVGVAPAFHQTTREFINNDDFAVLDHIVFICLEQVIGFQSLVDMVLQLHMRGISEIVQVEVTLHPGNAVLCQNDGMSLLIHCEVSLILKPFHEEISDLVHLRTLVPFAGNNQRGSGFINENGVDFIHDGEIQLALNHFFLVNDHVVSQIVKSELIVGSVRNIAVIGIAPFLVGQAMQDNPGGKAEEVIKLPHPFTL
ncbi:hypothetical protein SDC9_154760 [bioreactor metagenome]|uniref:Uncharacterized protein n=1 Tax=bioreactor metagenome TaxID=1076179 RepID=A0A645F158_9ZZZZ